MSLAEGVAARVAYKFYASGSITAGTEEVLASAPGASGGQILRRTSSTLSLSKDTYQSNEVLASRQIVDYRHGTRRVNGGVSGELSPGTYKELFQALLRGTMDSSISKTEADFTSVAFDNGASTATVGGSTWAAQGFRVGDTIRFTDLAETANNSVNFTITALSGTVATIYPAPTTAAADVAFTVVRPGKKVIVPTSSHVSRKVLFEVYNQDIDVTRVFTECRIGSGRVNMPATGMSTVEFGVMGRNMQVLTGGDSPYFTSPTAETSTGLLCAVNGALFVGGSRIGVVTGIDLSIDLSPTADPVVGQDFVPEIFLGRTNVTGTVTAFFQDATLLNYFINETEIELLAMMTTTTADNSPFWSVYLPRVKLGNANQETSGEGAQSISLPFQALLKPSTTGYDNTTIAILDSEA